MACFLGDCAPAHGNNPPVSSHGNFLSPATLFLWNVSLFPVAGEVVMLQRSHESPPPAPTGRCGSFYSSIRAEVYRGTVTVTCLCVLSTMRAPGLQERKLGMMVVVPRTPLLSTEDRRHCHSSFGRRRVEGLRCSRGIYCFIWPHHVPGPWESREVGLPQPLQGLDLTPEC